MGQRPARQPSPGDLCLDRTRAGLWDSRPRCSKRKKSRVAVARLHFASLAFLDVESISGYGSSPVLGSPSPANGSRRCCEG